MGEVNGKYIVDTNFVKISSTFRYDETLADSECSELYDVDPFFEGAEPTKNTYLAEELKD